MFWSPLQTSFIDPQTNKFDFQWVSPFAQKKIKLIVPNKTIQKS